MIERLKIDSSKKKIMSFCERAILKERVVFLGMTAQRFYFFSADKGRREDYICCLYIPNVSKKDSTNLYNKICVAIDKLEDWRIRLLADRTRNAVWTAVMTSEVE